jgi:hypothetical protein
VDTYPTRIHAVSDTDTFLSWSIGVTELSYVHLIDKRWVDLHSSSRLNLLRFTKCMRVK